MLGEMITILAENLIVIFAKKKELKKVSIDFAPKAVFKVLKKLSEFVP